MHSTFWMQICLKIALITSRAQTPSRTVAGLCIRNDQSKASEHGVFVTLIQCADRLVVSFSVQYNFEDNYEATVGCYHNVT